jgi:hypothetical protein
MEIYRGYDSSASGGSSGYRRKTRWYDYPTDLFGGFLLNAVPRTADSIVSLAEDVTSYFTGDDVNWVDIPDLYQNRTGLGEFSSEAGSFALGMISGSATLSALSKAGKLGRIARIAGVADKALKGGYGLTARVAASAGLGMPVDFVLGDSDGGNFSSLIQSFPQLANPITDYLSHKDDDSKLYRRLKNAMEGVPLGVASDYLLTGLGKLLKLKRAKLDESSDGVYRTREQRITEATGVAVMGEARAKKAFALFDPEEIERASAEVVEELPVSVDGSLDNIRKRGKQPVSDEIAHNTAAVSRMFSEAKSEKEQRNILGAFVSSQDRDTVLDTIEVAMKNHPANLPRKMADMAGEANQMIQEESAKRLFDDLGIPEAWKELARGEVEQTNQRIARAQFQRWVLLNSADHLVEESRRILQSGGNAVERERLLTLMEEFTEYVSLFREARGNDARVLKMYDTVVDPLGIKLKKSYGKRMKASELEKLTAEIREARGKESDPEQVRKLAETVVKHAEEVRSGNLKNLVKDTDGEQHPWLDALIEYRTSSMLSGFTTHAVDRIGTLFNQISRYLIEEPIASVIGRVRGNTERKTASEVLANLSGQLDGAMRFFGELSREMKNLPDDVTLFHRIGQALHRVNLGASERQISEGLRPAAFTSENLGITSKPLGWLLDRFGEVQRALSFGVMNAGDAWTGNQVFLGAVKREARMLASDAGIPTNQLQKFIDNVTTLVVEARRTGRVRKGTSEQAREVIENIVGTAVRESELMTYKQGLDPESAFGWFYSKVNGKGFKSKIMRLLFFPFVKTPVNILDNVFAHTPMLQKLSYEYRRAIASGDPAQRDLMTAKLITGSLLYLTGTGLYLSGHLTGSHSPEERQQLQAAGIQEYSILIGNRYYAYNRADPLGMYLGLVADLGRAARFSSDGDMEKATSSLILAGTNAVVNKTYLQTLGELIQCIQDPTRYLERFSSNLALSFLPLGGAQRFINNAGVAPEVKEVREFTDRLLNATVLAKGELPDKLDVFGYPVMTEAQPSAILLGVRTSKYTDRPSYREMAKFRIFPEDRPGKVLGVELSGEDWRRYKEIMRELGASEMLDRMVTSATYRGSSEKTRRDALRKTINRYRRVAASLTLQRSPGLQDAVHQRKRELELLSGTSDPSDWSDLSDPFDVVRYDIDTLSPDIGY